MTVIEKPRVRPSVTCRLEVVTPEIAAAWLEKNTTNRPVDQSVVDRYGRDMLAGRWLVTGDPIQFGESGRMLGGQHRCWACVQYDVIFRTYVVRGIPLEEEEAVMATLDSGKKRTLGNALAIYGEKDCSLLASIVNMIWRYEKGHLTRASYPTHGESIEWLRENDEVHAALSVARTVYAHLKAPPTPVGVAYHLNAKVDAEAAEEFWRLAADGAGLASGSPILAYRRWVISRLSNREKVTANTWLAYNMKAMNVWRAGKSMRLLSVKAAEDLPEPWQS